MRILDTHHHLWDISLRPYDWINQLPKNESRIRVQISSAHTEQQIQFAIDAFKKCGKKYKLI